MTFPPLPPTPRVQYALLLLLSLLFLFFFPPSPPPPLINIPPLPPFSSLSLSRMDGSAALALSLSLVQEGPPFTSPWEIWSVPPRPRPWSYWRARERPTPPTRTECWCVSSCRVRVCVRGGRGVPRDCPSFRFVRPAPSMRLKLGGICPNLDPAGRPPSPPPPPLPPRPGSLVFFLFFFPIFLFENLKFFGIPDFFSFFLKRSFWEGASCLFRSRVLGVGQSGLSGRSVGRGGFRNSWRRRSTTQAADGRAMWVWRRHTHTHTHRDKERREFMKG